MLAHELRNPLAPIRNAVQVMARLPPGDAAHETMRRTIDRQSEHLVRIVDDMLDIVRITRGTLAMEHSAVDIAEVVRLALEAARPEIEAARHTVEIDLPPDPPIVNGDLHRLAQVMTNLLNNAARYTPPGGHIAVAARVENGAAVLRVRDTGSGIDPRALESIFEMFVQASPRQKRAGGGLGIGLALARRIAELHGGALEAHSEGPGQGSEFTLRLPLMQGQSADAELAAQAEPPALPRVVPRRVLVVDDNVDAATTLGRVLQSLGHDTCVVHDGAQALARVAEFHPDIVLLDIGMPGLDGYEVARRLRALKGERPFRIVAVTGWGQEADREKARDAGFDVHLVKPVEVSDLVRALQGPGENNGSWLH
jgi:CheY-like chemotaxis protein